MRFYKLIFIIITLYIGVVACHVTDRESIPIVTLNLKNCNPQSGCVLRINGTFSVSNSPLNALSLKFKDLFKTQKTKEQIFSASSEKLVVCGIQINESSGLFRHGESQGNNSLSTTPTDCQNAEITWLPKEMACEYFQTQKSASTFQYSAECPNYFPIGTNFTFSFMPPNLSPFQTISPPAVQIVVFNTSSFAGDTITKLAQCGQWNEIPNATTYQRLFDCQNVNNHSAGIGNSENSVTYFQKALNSPACMDSTDINSNTNCNPDKNWFLVACDANQNCIWLSPVLTANNPVVSTPGQYATLLEQPDPSFENFSLIPMSNYQNTRLLWSSRISGLSFFEANGKTALLKPNGELIDNIYTYWYYPVINSSTMAFQNINSDSEGSIFAPSAENIMNNLMPRIADFYQSSYDTVSSDTSFCKLLNRPESVYNWQMPSYPMIMTLTGGGICTANPDAVGRCNPQGFKAFNQIPNFRYKVWSSSVGSSEFAWIFDGSSGGSMGAVQLFPFDITFGEGPNTLCVSTVW